MYILTLSEQIYYKYVYIYEENMKTLDWYKCFPYNASRMRNVRVIHFLNLLNFPPNAFNHCQSQNFKHIR